MIYSALIFSIASLCVAACLWVLLPGRNWPATAQRRIALGAILGMGCLALYVSQLPGVGGLATGLIYYPLTGIVLIAASATITSRNPVHSAAWFALSLLGVSGLFFLEGAPWLALANLGVHSMVLLGIYYFVLREAIARRCVAYDRKTNEPLLSAVTGAVIAGVLAAAIGNAPVEKSALSHNYLVLGAILFGIGLTGFLSRRNLILRFLSIDIILQGVLLSMVAWGRWHNDFGGQTMVAVILAAIGCEVAIALMLIRFSLNCRGCLDIISKHETDEGTPLQSGRYDE